MKFISFRHQSEESYGMVVGNGVVDLKKRLGSPYSCLKCLLNESGLESVNRFAEEKFVDYPLTDITYLPVIPNPDKIFCIGTNYDEHRIEANREKTDYPVVFFRLPGSQIGHNEPIPLPKESSMLDYEGEVAVIIGRKGRRIPEDQAFEYVAGYSCYNDATIRDWQRHTHQWGPGKNFEATGAFGPWMVTRDEIGDHETLTLETRLNGETMQSASTDMLLFSIPRIISYLSTFITLVPGDVIVTGTPGGVGFKRNPPVYMKPGDVVEIEVSRIGILKNTIIGE